MKVLRDKGLKVGCFRPITLSPFPHERISELAEQGKQFVVVEMNMGQMFKDIKYAVNGKSEYNYAEWRMKDELQRIS
jgi:2-oxoglutarate ferredoxin oxidoreductase subunit alpha